MIKDAILGAHKKRKDRGYDTTYWCIDLHGTIIKPTYEKADNHASIFYAGSIKVLKALTKEKSHKLILWTCTHEEDLHPVLDKMESLGIKFDFINESPECKSTALCDFSKKLYFDILLDDKAGFTPNSDWLQISQVLALLGYDW